MVKRYTISWKELYRVTYRRLFPLRMINNGSPSRQYGTRTSSVSTPPPTAMDHHETAVKAISLAVKSFYDRKVPFRISHGTTNSTRPDNKEHLISTSSLSSVLHIDEQKRIALVEPNVPMDRLIEATLACSLVPAVVMEFPGITVGGGYNGTSGESSSFKYGFFNNTIGSIEMVLADGSVVTASPTQNSDLFYGAAGAVGTFGVTTLVELQLIPSTKYVETTYYPVTSIEAAIEAIQSFTVDKSSDYIDGIIFSKTSGAIITGRMTNTPGPHTIQRFSSPKDPWFYLHVKDVITKFPTTPTTEIIPIAEYLFRYDRGGFWVGTSAFDYFRFPFNALTRWFLDDFLHTRMMYTALHASGESERYIVQDLALPYSSAGEFINFTHGKFGIYPLWLCPLKQSPAPTMHPHHVIKKADGSITQDEMINIGLWGYCPAHLDFVSANRDIEKKLREVGGMKWLYAHTYYTEEEFWEMYDKEWYESLRKKYNATSLPSVYDKVKVDIERKGKMKTIGERLLGIPPIGGFWGIRKAIESGLYLDARKSAWKDL